MSSPIGTGAITGANGINSAPPFKTVPSSPLNAQTKAQILAWINGNKVTTTQYGGALPANISDSDLLMVFRNELSLYAPPSVIQTVPIVGNAAQSTVNAVIDPLKSLYGGLTNQNTWIRVAEFAVGFLMLGIAIKGIVSATTGSAGAKAGGALKTAGTVVNPLSSPNRKRRAVAGQYAQREASRQASHVRRENSRDLAHGRKLVAADAATQNRIALKSAPTPGRVRPVVATRRPDGESTYKDWTPGHRKPSAEPRHQQYSNDTPIDLNAPIL